MLVIVNPYATAMTARLKNLVVYALQGRYEVEAIETERRGHAIELVTAAVGQAFDVVVAFGGDGTVNEAANGLADRKSTRLNSSHANISYAVFCLKKKQKTKK